MNCPYEPTAAVRFRHAATDILLEMTGNSDDNSDKWARRENRSASRLFNHTSRRPGWNTASHPVRILPRSAPTSATRRRPIRNMPRMGWTRGSRTGKQLFMVHVMDADGLRRLCVALLVSMLAHWPLGAGARTGRLRYLRCPTLRGSPLRSAGATNQELLERLLKMEDRLNQVTKQNEAALAGGPGTQTRESGPERGGRGPRRRDAARCWPGGGSARRGRTLGHAPGDQRGRLGIRRR